jgi:hypothetical protein
MTQTGKPPTERIYSLGVEPRLIPDPGNGGAIDTLQDGYCEITSTGVETRTLSDPQRKGQIIDIVFITDGGTVTITAASPLNQAGNTVITLTDVGEHTRLMGAWNATDGWEWRQIANDGAALS